MLSVYIGFIRNNPVVDVLDEFDDPGHVQFLFVVHAQMAAAWAVQKMAILHLPRHPLHVFRIHRAITRADHQRRHRDFLELFARARAELIVVVELDARAREPAVEGFQIGMAHARAAGQQQHLDARVVAKAPSPDPESVVRFLYCDHAHAARERIGIAAVVVVAGGWCLGAGSSEHRRIHDDDQAGHKSTICRETSCRITFYDFLRDRQLSINIIYYFRGSINT